MSGQNHNRAHLLATGGSRMCWVALAACLMLGACETGSVKTVKRPERGEYSVRDVPVTQGFYKVGGPYKKDGVVYRPVEDWTYNEVGLASWYGRDHHGKRTANGETFDLRALTAAHPTLPMPTRIRVTNLENGKSLELRLNDRGPYKPGRLIDVSERAAELLGFKEQGAAMVRVEMLGRAPLELFRMAKPKTSAPEQAGWAAPNEPVTTTVLTPPPPAPRQETAAALDGPPAVPQSGNAAADADPLSELFATVTNKTPTPAGADAAGSPPQAAASRTQEPPSECCEQAAPARRWFVQAGSFTVPENAYNLRRVILHVIKDANVLIEPSQVGEREFFRVRVGPMSSSAEADDMLARIHKLGQNDAEIVID